MTTRTKHVLALTLITLVSFALWYTARWLLWGDFEWAGRLFSPLGPFILLLAVLTLYLFVVAKQSLIWLTALAVLVPYTIALGAGWWQLLAVALALLIMRLTVRSLHNERSQRLSVSISNTLKIGVPSLITALTILIAGAFIYNPEVQRVKGPEELTNLFERMVHASVETTFGGKYFEYTPPATRQAIERQITRYAQNSLEGDWQNYVNYIPLIASVALFLVLRALGFVYTWLTLPIGVMIYKLLVKYKFINFEVTHKEASTPYL